MVVLIQYMSQSTNTIKGQVFQVGVILWFCHTYARFRVAPPLTVAPHSHSSIKSSARRSLIVLQFKLWDTTSYSAPSFHKYRPPHRPMTISKRYRPPTRSNVAQNIMMDSNRSVRSNRSRSWRQDEQSKIRYSRRFTWSYVAAWSINGNVWTWTDGTFLVATSFYELGVSNVVWQTY